MLAALFLQICNVFLQIINHFCVRLGIEPGLLKLSFGFCELQFELLDFFLRRFEITYGFVQLLQFFGADSILGNLNLICLDVLHSAQNEPNKKEGNAHTEQTWLLLRQMQAGCVAT